jgi:hypothetical protein
MTDVSLTIGSWAVVVVVAISDKRSNTRTRRNRDRRHTPLAPFVPLAGFALEPLPHIVSVCFCLLLLLLLRQLDR